MYMDIPSTCLSHHTNKIAPLTADVLYRIGTIRSCTRNSVDASLMHVVDIPSMQVDGPIDHAHSGVLSTDDICSPTGTHNVLQLSATASHLYSNTVVCTVFDTTRVARITSSSGAVMGRYKTPARHRWVYSPGASFRCKCGVAHVGAGTHRALRGTFVGTLYG